MEAEVNDTEKMKLFIPKDDIIQAVEQHSTDSNGGTMTLNSNTDHFDLVTVKQLTDPHYEKEDFWKTSGGYVTIVVISLCAFGVSANIIYVAVDSYLFSRAGK